MTREPSAYGRIPRVRRVEYVVAFLEGIAAHSTLEAAGEQIHIAMERIANDRARAFGKKVPRVTAGHQLTQQCLQLSTRTGLVTGKASALSITPAGRQLLEAGNSPVSLLLNRLWSCYPVFGYVVSGLAACDGEVVLPISRASSVFADAAKSYNLAVDHISFEIVRDLLAECEVLNWRLLRGEAGAQQSVYLTIYPEKRTSPDNLARIPVPVAEEFEAVLWEKYLSITNFRPNLPILYPELRDSVCHHFRIPDRHYDSTVTHLINKPERLLIHPAGGIIEYTSSMWLISKNIPPQMPSGEYISYLRMDRKA